MKLARCLAALACACAGCYGPTIADGQYTCVDGVCPSGFACTKCDRCVRQGEPLDDAPCGTCVNGSCPSPEVCTACGLCQPAGTETNDKPCHRDGCTNAGGVRDKVDPDLARVAFCAAAWDVPGVVTDGSRAPSCNRAPSATGAGCSAADNCAAGWHVCEGDADAQSNGLTRTLCMAVDNDPHPGFWTTRQHGDQDMTGAFLCSTDTTLANNLYGCGMLFNNAQIPSPMCNVLTQTIGRSDCDANNPPWYCGMDDPEVHEGELVTKSTLDQGGVICCHD